MFPATYFAPRYFAHVYFPGANAAKVRYFPHRYFAQRYFPDRYFPGNLSTGVVEPPIEPVEEFVGAGGLPVRFIPTIHVIADLVLPELEFQAFGYTTSAWIHVHADLALPLPTLSFSWQIQSDQVPIQTVGLLLWDGLVFSGTLHQRPPRKRMVEEDDEQVLLEHYMLTTYKGR
jgi:hypothetical protein